MGSRQAISYCRICMGGCGVVLDLDDDGHITGVKADPENPLSNGYACFKGLQSHKAHNGPERLLHPLKRQPDGSYVRIGLEQALDEIAEKLGAIIARDGPDAAGIFLGNGTFPNSTGLPMARNFLQAIGSKQYFTTVTIDLSAKQVTVGRLGMWGAGYRPLEEIDVALAIGTNPLISHSTGPLLMCDPVKNLKKARARGMKLIVIDPRESQTAALADLHLRPYPGQDALVIGAILRIILEEGWEDKEFVEHHVGADRMHALATALAPLQADVIEQRTGLAAGQLRQAAELFAHNSRTGYASSGTGSTMAPFSNLTAHLVECLNVVCGRYLREGDRVHSESALSPSRPLRAEVFPASRPWEAMGPSRIRGVNNLFGERLTGTLADEILTEGEGQLKALFTHGSNPALSLPDQEKAVKALRSLELLVSVDPNPSATAKIAHYVLPTFMQYERADLPLSIGGMALWPRAWAQFTPAVATPPEDAELADDWYVMWGIAKRLGKAIVYDGRHPLDMEKAPTTEELLAMRLEGARASIEDLRQHPHGKFYPIQQDRVLPARPGSDARFDVMPTDVAAELAALIGKQDRPGQWMRDGKSFTHLLLSRRSRDLYNNIGYWNAGVRKRNPYNPAYLHPDDLAELGIAEGQQIELVTAHGRAMAIAGKDETMRRGAVSLAHGWGDLPHDPRGPEAIGTAINKLIDTDSNYEDINAMPHMSAVPVNICAVAAQAVDPSFSA